MRKILFFCCALSAALSLTQCGINTDPEITVSDTVVKTAKAAKFDYVATLEKARKGDNDAIKLVFDYTRFADGLEGFDHGLTCLEMIQVVGDAPSAGACGTFKPGLKKLILERLIHAQTMTKKEPLKTPIQQLFPLTYSALNVIEKVAAPTDTTATVQQPGTTAKMIKVDSLVKLKNVDPSQFQKAAEKK